MGEGKTFVLLCGWCKQIPVCYFHELNSLWCWYIFGNTLFRCASLTSPAKIRKAFRWAVTKQSAAHEYTGTVGRMETTKYCSCYENVVPPSWYSLVGIRNGSSLTTYEHTEWHCDSRSRSHKANFRSKQTHPQIYCISYEFNQITRKFSKA